MRFVLFFLFTLVAACTQASESIKPTKTESAFTFGNLMTAEEVVVTESELDEAILARLTSAKLDQRYYLAILSQLSGDGILCDLMMTRIIMDTVKPTPTFNEAALASQRECVNGAIVLETEIADMLQSQ